jgi:hypothetical protein
MVSRSEVINDIFTLLAQVENRTLPFSSLLKSSVLSHYELLYILNGFERAGFVSHTTDFWGDPQSYTLLIELDEFSV